MQARTLVQMKLSGAWMRWAGAEDRTAGVVYPSAHLRSVSLESGNDSAGEGSARLGIMAWGGVGVPKPPGSKQSISLGRGAAHSGTQDVFLPRQKAASAPGCLHCLTVQLLADVCLSGPCLQIHTMGGTLKPWLGLPFQTLKHHAHGRGWGPGLVLTALDPCPALPPPSCVTVPL